MLVLFASGCAHWALPKDPVVRGGDSRNCSSRVSCVDLLIAVDTSVSSAHEVGAPDSWANDVFGYPDVGPESRLWVGLDGLRDALRELDPAYVGVSLMAFAGAPKRPNEAGWIEAEVTNSFPAVERAADRLRARGASGSSCHGCAVMTAAPLIENAQKTNRCVALILLADAEPTLPYGPAFPDDNNRAIAAALRKVGVPATLVAVGQSGDERVARIQTALAQAGGRVSTPEDRGGVAKAILAAVGSCRR